MLRAIALAGAVLVAAWSLLGDRPLSADDVSRMPATKPVAAIRYGQDALQYAELRLPKGQGPFPVVVVIHGGCWTKGLATLRNTAPLASAITSMGYATWNIEYRQVGDAGGGWPGSFADWGAATDFLRTLAKTYPIDLNRVGVIGHSAGAYAALWVAARPAVPAGTAVSAGEPLPVKLAVAVDGPTDVTPFFGRDKTFCGAPVISGLMGGSPAQVPDRYRIADLPDVHDPPVREALIGSLLLQPRMMAPYKAAGARKGQTIDTLTVSDTGHFEPIAPTSDPWRTQVAPFLRKELATLKR